MFNGFDDYEMGCLRYAMFQFPFSYSTELLGKPTNHHKDNKRQASNLSDEPSELERGSSLSLFNLKNQAHFNRTVSTELSTFSNSQDVIQKLLGRASKCITENVST